MRSLRGILLVGALTLLIGGVLAFGSGSYASIVRRSGMLLATVFGWSTSPNAASGERSTERDSCALPTIRRVLDTTSMDPPNVVMVVVDTLRADHLGLYGHVRSTSPHLDRLGTDSLVFERAIAPAPWTTPSLSSMFTGRQPGALGILDEPRELPREVRTLAEVLVTRGYATAGVISHSYLGSRYGFDRGFDVWNESSAKGHEFVSSPRVTRIALSCLDALAARTEHPFFLFVHYFDPHYDYIEHEQYAFPEAGQSDWRNWSWIHSAGDNIGFLRRLAKFGLLREADRHNLTDRYDSEIAFTDAHIGQLLQRLRDLGLYEDALIIFTADHGEMFGERKERWLGHTKYLYDELLHVPLVVKLPGQTLVGTVEQTVATADIMPTVLGMIDPDSPTQRSLLRQETRRAGPVFSQTRSGEMLDAVYLGDWKLIANRNTKELELYDLRSDPSEQRNVIKAEPRRSAELKATLDRWTAQVERSGEQLPKRRTPEPTPEQKERLRGLGYAP